MPWHGGLTLTVSHSSCRVVVLGNTLEAGAVLLLLETALRSHTQWSFSSCSAAGLAILTADDSGPPAVYL